MPNIFTNVQPPVSVAERAAILYTYGQHTRVDQLVQVELTDEYEHSPIATGDNTLTL